MLTLFHQIFTPANTGFMLKGLGMTIVIAVLAILISMANTAMTMVIPSPFNIKPVLAGVKIW